MKSIKIIAIIAFFFTANLSAQNAAWPALKTYDDVITRIVAQSQKSDFASVKYYAETLSLKSKALAKAEIPAAYDNKKVKAQIEKLEVKSGEVYTLASANAANSSILEAVKEAEAIYREIVSLTVGKK